MVEGVPLEHLVFTGESDSNTGNGLDGGVLLEVLEFLGAGASRCSFGRHLEVDSGMVWSEGGKGWSGLEGEVLCWLGVVSLVVVVGEFILGCRGFGSSGAWQCRIGGRSSDSWEE